MRSTWESYGVRKYALQVNCLRTAAAYSELQLLEGFHEIHAGGYDSFRLTDPDFNAVAAHPFGVGDGTTTSFQLQRTLAPSSLLAAPVSRNYWPAIGSGYEPIFDLNGTPQLFKDVGAGPVLLTPSTDYSIDTFSNVTLAVAPASGAILSWTGSYFLRVRFADPELPTKRVVNGVYSSTFNLIGVKTEELPPLASVYVPILYAEAFTTGTGPFTLSRIPLVGYAVTVEYNGIDMRDTVDFTHLGAVVTPIGTNIPASGESYVVKYFA